MATNDPNRPVTPQELFDDWGDIEALHYAAGDQGTLIVNKYGGIEVVPSTPVQESSNG
jgi:hypothetical protein